VTGAASDLFRDLDRLCVDTFGQPVLYRISDSDPGVEIVAVLDEDPVTGQLMDGSSRGEVGMVAVSTAETILFVQRSVLPISPEEGHRVDIDGDRYRVSEVRPDGPASWTLVLKKLVRR
jgi:hypothetical protein